VSDGTAIEWTDATWNPVTGCTPVSEGCDHCYAKRIYERFHGKGSFEKVELHPDRLDAPLHWRKARTVFVNSMSDLFHDGVPGVFIGAVWATMADTPQHTYQILTKRPGRMASVLRTYAKWCGPSNAVLPNVWLGVSVENQKWADVRIPKLLETPAAVRFLSCEPLLGPVDLDNEEWLPPWGDGQGRAIDWVIVGGESGPGARPTHPDWVRSLRDQCVAAGVPFFFKQWGEYVHRDALSDYLAREIDSSENLAGNPQKWFRVGKKLGGREVDGRTWDEYPC
jgi:protein gp37